MDQRLVDKLNIRREEGTLRSLSHFDGYVDFFSNDYLGLATSGNTTSFTGSTGSRLISGTCRSMVDSECDLADFFEADAAVMFNSGYDANLGFFSAVPQRGDTVIYDELIHASVRDGIRLGFANSMSFAHNSTDSLRDCITRANGSVYVAVESLYSMDGDMSPLKDIASICREHGAYLVVDEAHAAGVFGDEGKGLVEKTGLTDQVFARLVTFGKAYGSHGGCILGEQELINFLVNYARSFIYTTALPKEVYEHNAKVVGLDHLKAKRKELEENIRYFRTNFKNDELISASTSPIQIVRVGDIKRTREIALMLQAERLAVKPIYSPTVPKGEERIRICLHAFNTHKEIDMLISLLAS